MKYKNFDEFPVWIEARKMMMSFYTLFQTNEKLQHAYRLKNQMLRASLSIMNNIAEGFDCPSKMEKIRFYEYVKRSSSEVESMLFVFLYMQAITEGEFERLLLNIQSIRKQMNGLIKNRKKL